MKLSKKGFMIYLITAIYGIICGMSILEFYRNFQFFEIIFALLCSIFLPVIIHETIMGDESK